MDEDIFKRLADIDGRLDKFLDLFIEHTADRKEVEVFQTDQILKCRAEQMMADRKTPRRRLNEVEQQVVNMNRFYQERIAELTHTLNEVKAKVKSGRKSNTYNYSNIVIEEESVTDKGNSPSRATRA